MPRQTDHMHTVPVGYLRRFADRSVGRDTAHVWRFGREASEPRLIGVRDVSVKRGIYKLLSETKPPDIFIETELLAKTVELGFPELVALLEAGKDPSYWGWRRLSRFLAFQLLRTPRAFQMIRDACAAQAIEIGRNGPQLNMIWMAPKIENWICQLEWLVLSNSTTFPFLTSDNPVTPWADRGGGFEAGVGFHDPSFRLFFPLTPTLAIAALQTSVSLKGISGDPPQRPGSFRDLFDLSIQKGVLTAEGVWIHNRVTIAFAENYVYANGNDDRLRLFLKEHFIGQPGPVRRSDRRPFGSPPCA
jgi:hypothetical protein